MCVCESFLSSYIYIYIFLFIYIRPFVLDLALHACLGSELQGATRSRASVLYLSAS